MIVPEMSFLNDPLSKIPDFERETLKCNFILDKKSSFGILIQKNEGRYIAYRAGTMVNYIKNKKADTRIRRRRTEQGTGCFARW